MTVKIVYERIGCIWRESDAKMFEFCFQKKRKKFLKVLILWYTAMSRRASYDHTYGQLENL